MTRDEQIRMAEANLALLRGTIWGALVKADLTGDGAMVPTGVRPMEVDGNGNYTGEILIDRGGVTYRLTVDYA